MSKVKSYYEEEIVEMYESYEDWLDETIDYNEDYIDSLADELFGE